MPIYEYRCEECGHRDEHLQKLSEAPLSVCPSCQKASYRKQLSAAGFQLKGSGWYATDFRNSGSKPAQKPSKDGSAAESKSEAKADSKAEPKPDSKADAKNESKPAPKSEATA